MALASSNCASCIFGAVSSRTLAFSYSQIDEVTITVIPHITVYPNGSQATSWETDSQSVTEFIGSASSQGPIETFSNINSITWTVGDATLTWPTTYVQYLGFKGAPLTSGNGESCANAAQATPVLLPSTTDAASLIYPLTSGATGAMPLPTALLDYLGQLDLVASQFDGDALTGCAPLDSSSINARHETEQRQKRFEGARRGILPEARSASPAFTQANSTSRVGQRSSSSSNLPSSEQSISSSQGAASASAVITSSTDFSSSSLNTVPVSFSISNPPVSATSSSNGTLSSNGPLNSNGTCISANGTCTTFSISSASVHHGHERPKVPSPIYRHSSVSAVGFTTSTGSPIITTVGGHNHKTPTPKVTGFNPHISPGKPTTKNPTSKTSKGHPNAKPAGPNEPGKTPGHVSIKTGRQGTLPGGKNGVKPHASVFTVGKATFTEKTGGIVIGSHTVHGGQKITIGHGASATTFAVQTKGRHTHLVVEGTTYKPTEVTRDSSSPTEDPPHVVITTNGHTITALRSGSSVIIKGGHSKTTIPAGGRVTFDGQTISAAKHGTAVVVNGTPEPLASASQVIVTAGGHTFTAAQSGNSVVLSDKSSTATIKDGSKTVFEGQTISVGSNGRTIIVNGKPTVIPEGSPSTRTEAVITAGGHTITAIEERSSIILEDGSSTVTVKDGAKITFDGQAVSAGKHGSAVVVNGKTIPVTATTIGPSGFGSASTSTGSGKNGSSRATERGALLRAVYGSCIGLTILFSALAIL